MKAAELKRKRDNEADSEEDEVENITLLGKNCLVRSYSETKFYVGKFEANFLKLSMMKAKLV